MKRLLLLMIVFFGGIVQVVAENTLFYDSKQLTCDLITSICQDKDGFIWIGTDYGLNKFNGIQFTHYYNNPKDSTSLSDNSVKALMLVMKARYGWEVLADYNIMFRKKMHFGQLSLKKAHLFISCVSLNCVRAKYGLDLPEEEYSVFGKIQEQVSK